MKTSIASELVKLRRRGIYLASTLVIALFALSALITVATASNTAATRQSGPGSGLTLQALAAADGLARTVSSGTSIVGAVVLAIVAYSFASEYSQGTLRNLLVREPRRITLFSGKLLATLALVAVTTLLGIAMAAVAGAAVAQARSISTASWTSAAGSQDFASAVAQITASNLGWAVCGAALGLAVRAPTVAVTAGLAYALPIETLLSAAWSSGREWLPGQLLGALADGGSTAVSASQATVVLAVYLGVALLATGVSLRWRDVGA